MFYFQKLVLTVKFLFEQILRIFSSLLFFLPRKRKKLNHFSGFILSSWGEAESGFVDINSKLCKFVLVMKNMAVEWHTM